MKVPGIFVFVYLRNLLSPQIDTLIIVGEFLRATATTARYIS